MNYRINAIEYLLCKDCLMERYYPLIPYKQVLITGLKKLGCETKEQVCLLSDEELVEAGVPDSKMIDLFRRFLVMYDVKNKKLKEIEKLPLTSDERQSFMELYQLPGVKETRARLYYIAGYTSLKAIATTAPYDMLSVISEIIRKEQLDCKLPLPKEVRTHIAVSKAAISMTDSMLAICGLDCTLCPSHARKKSPCEGCKGSDMSPDRNLRFL